jgi:4-hydroxy-3-methylbut-2-enyl diphosphate reductase
MVVVGGKNSGNTRRLAQICADVCERTHHIEESSELQAAWFVNAHHIGITAGASTPQEHIERAVERIKELCR